MNVIQTEKGLIKHWTEGVQFEDEARLQTERLSNMPFIFKHIAVMADVHAGRGATVGTVIATDGAVVPSAVGTDIGCGMVAGKLTLRADQLPDKLTAMRWNIEKVVPLAATAGHGDTVPTNVAQAYAHELVDGLTEIAEKYPLPNTQRALPQLGTLGTGNHFIEVSVDEGGAVWAMLHSGSRGIGNAIGELFIRRAQKLCADFFITLEDRDLAYLPSSHELFADYMKAVQWAQSYAWMNRNLMFGAVLNAIDKTLGGKISCELAEPAVHVHHNYVEREHHFGRNVWVTRKGAVRAREGELGVIPGSMGTRSYIVRGKGNADSFMSCSHGAGRAMSRTKARQTFTLADHRAATTGVECRQDEGVLDETPGAYKDVDAVIAAQADLIEVVHTLKAVLCVKG